VGSTAVDEGQLDHLRNGLRGAVTVPGEASYEEARALFNSMITKQPAVIAQCADAGDVATALAFGQEAGLEVAVRGGGHSVAGAGLADGGLAIDLRRLDAASVDPDARTVTVGGGATMSRLDRATEPYGLATTGGRVSTTGVGGFTLGGGTGWLDRKLGLACDRLVSVSLVLAHGEQVRASADENPDLFWALHGGGGNFGVATSFTFRLDPVTNVTAALMLWRPESGPTVLRRYRDLIAEAPDEVGGGFIYLTAPAEDFVPPEMVDRLAAAVLVTYVGSEEEARPFIDPMLELAPSARMLVEQSYADFQCMLDDPPGYRNYWTVEHLSSLPDVAVDLLCARAYDMVVPSPSQHVLFPQGGRVAREGHEWPTPFRSAAWAVHPFGLWENPRDDERAIQWARRIRTDMQPWATGDVYLNFVGDEGEDRVAAGFGRDYERLARIKAEYDPGNVFHVNHNIKPAPSIPAPR
jgi:FAD/FMN-containing dehydrogenase